MREIKIPGPQHWVAIEPFAGEVSVLVAGAEIASSERALVMHEDGHAPVYYLPLADIDERLLQRSDSTSYCPYKGDCSYFTVTTPTTNVADAGWTYEDPYAAVAEIAGHVAFYARRVDLMVRAS